MPCSAGYLGYEALAALADGRSSGGGESGRAKFGSRGEVAVQVASAVLGAVGGWVVGWVVDRALVWFFGVFNAGFKLATSGYSRVVGLMLRGSVAVLMVYGGLLGLTYVSFDSRTPARVHSRRRTWAISWCNVSSSRTRPRGADQGVMDRIERIARKTPGVKHTQAITGQSLLLGANGSNFGVDVLHPRLVRPTGGRRIFTAKRSSHELRKRSSAEKVPEAMVDGARLRRRCAGSSARAGGFKLMIEDRGDNWPHGHPPGADR